MSRYMRGVTEVIICSAEELEALLQVMSPDKGYFPQYDIKPLIKKKRRYGLCLVRKNNLYDWYIVSASTLVRWFEDGELKRKEET